MRFEKTRQFTREFERLPDHLQEKAIAALRQFAANPSHPSLHVKKMQGTQDVWELRVSYSYRITFLRASNVVILRHIGTHDILREEK